jgi:type I restriction enzyme S subunit
MLDEKKISGKYLAPYLRNTDVQWGRINIEDLPSMDFDGNDISRYSLKRGDLLVCEGGEVGRAALWRDELSPCFYQKALHRLRPRQALSDVPEYLFYVLRSAVDRGVFGAAEGKSTISHLPAEAFRRYLFPFPPLPEQRSIAAFLDRETAKIDALVEAQRRLIELLKEKRQAVISHAVTKGLDPTAPMKDSGIEWLGEVPAHWKVERLANLFTEVSEPGNDSLPILSVSIHRGVSDSEIPEDELERKVSRSDDRSKYKAVQPLDLVYNMMRAWQGGFGTVTVPGAVSPAYVVARPRIPLATEFIEWALRTPTCVEEMRRRSVGVTDFRLRLYWDSFKDLRVGVPDLEEQAAILKAIGAEIQKYAYLSDAAVSAIALLQERRAALISAAVTGKIDVRGASQQAAAA